MASLTQQFLIRYPALTFPLYRRYWFASFASVGATQLIMLGQAWLIFELTESALYLGYLGLAAALPNIILTLVGGVLADRFNKRTILRSTSLAITFLLALLAWLDFSEQITAWQVLTIAGLFSFVTGLDWPTRVALYPHLVDRRAFMSAVALNSFIWQATRMAMPALGGLLIYYADTWLIFLLGALGFATMFVTISTIRVDLPATQEHSPWQQLKQGVSFIWHTSLFKWLIGLTFCAMFFSQSYIQILPVFVDAMGLAEQGYGYLLSAGGVGSIVGTLVVGALREDRPISSLMFGGAALSVIGAWLFVLATSAGSFGAALAAVFTAALFSSIFMITSMTILQLRVPDNMRGRVMGIHTMGYSMIPLGGMLLGGLAEWLAPGRAVLLTTGLFMLILAGTWWSRRDLRQLTNQPA
jgi:predicted MFS family arabinose efflux permease